VALNKKQKMALELLTSGRGMSFKEIAEEVGVSAKTLWNWRNGNDFTEFQEELKRLNDIRWQAAEDAAREGAIKLCKDGNQKMIQFVLQNAGYNPTTKLEADVKTDIVINIDEEEDHLC
jgi:transcriptional regulator with XRE-family HTH domain